MDTAKILAFVFLLAMLASKCGFDYIADDKQEFLNIENDVPCC